MIDPYLQVLLWNSLQSLVLISLWWIRMLKSQKNLNSNIPMNWARWAYSSCTVSGKRIQLPTSRSINFICSLHNSSKVKFIRFKFQHLTPKLTPSLNILLIKFLNTFLEKVNFREKNSATYLIRKESVVTRHQPEKNQVVKQDLLHGSPVQEWAQVHHPLPKNIREEKLPGNFSRGCVPSQAFGIRVWVCNACG